MTRRTHSLFAFGLLSLAVAGCAGTQTGEAPKPAGSNPAPSTAGNGADTETALKAALAANHRLPAQSARDQYRHPLETLTFFGLKKEMTVVELWPGGDAWYTAVLAPVLAEKGKLIATNFDPNSADANR